MRRGSVRSKVSSLASRGVVLVLLAIGGSFGCGDGSGYDPSGAVSCIQNVTQKIAGKLFTTPSCAESTGLSADQVEAMRAQCSGTRTAMDGGVTVSSSFSYQPCSLTKTIGGCRLATGATSTMTLWYYATEYMTPSAVKSTCDLMGASFVPAGSSPGGG
jgi:hypothetical protein